MFCFQHETRRLTFFVVGGWTKNGESFVIKDAVAFSTQVIPQFFRHNNFSSFVRQLNFYGFRKVRTDHIFNSQEEVKYWEFKHECFKRGHPELMGKIKRSTHGSGNAFRLLYD